MICSASDFNSSGLRGDDESSGTSSPFTRMVAGRPTLSSRSDALRWTIWVMAALKLNVACPAWGASGMGVHPEEEPADLDGAQLGRFPQDLHQLGDDVEVHGSQSYTSSNRSVSPSLKSSGPAAARCTSSSIRTPPSPARYTPGSMVTTAPAGRGSGLVFESRGASCTSSPSP